MKRKLLLTFSSLLLVTLVACNATTDGTPKEDETKDTNETANEKQKRIAKEKEEERIAEEKKQKDNAMTKNIDDFMDIIFKNEGEYSDLAADSGGKTKYGITETNWNAKKGQLKLDLNGRILSDISIDKITKDDAKKFYELYWKESSLDYENMTKSLGLVMLDTTVLMWQGDKSEYIAGSVEFFQQAINELDYLDDILSNLSSKEKSKCNLTPKLLEKGKLPQDGGWGPQTKCVLKSLDYKKQKTVANKILKLREAYHRKYANNVNRQQTFEEGWQNRVDTLRRLVDKLEY